MTRQIILLIFFLCLSLSSFSQRKFYVLTFRNLKNEKRERVLKCHQYSQHFKFKTLDSTYVISKIVSVNDTSIIVNNWNDTILIPLKKIISIKMINGTAEGIGYTLIAMCAVGFVIDVPYELIKYGPDKAWETIIAVPILASISLPFIIIGSIHTKVNLKKWKIISFNLEVEED